MLKKSIVLLTVSCGLVFAPEAKSQECSTHLQPNTVSVIADGKYEAEPDTALLQFNISVQEDKAKAAFEHASKNAEHIRQVLRDNGIDPKLAEVGHFSVVPIFEWRQSKRKPKAYRVNAVTKLKLKDFAKIGTIIQQLTETDFTDNETVDYTLEDIEAAKQKAVENAYRRANDSAAAVAKAGGRLLGELSMASVDSFEQVQSQGLHHESLEMAQIANDSLLPHKQAEYSAPTSDFSAQTVVVKARIHAVFLLK